MAPDFELKDLKGRSVVLSELRGKAVLLAFWATWAGPGRMCLPDLVRLKRDYGVRHDGKYFTVLGVTAGEKAGQVREFMDMNPVNFTVLVGDDAVVKAYFGDGDVKLPLVVLVDEQGRIVERFIGYHPYDEMAPEVDRIVSRLRQAGEGKVVTEGEEPSGDGAGTPASRRFRS